MSRTKRKNCTRSCLSEELTNAAWAFAEVRFRSAPFTEARHVIGQQEVTS